MTVVPASSPTPAKNVGGRPKGSTGNGKTLKEMAAREERSLARIDMERRAGEARAAAEDVSRIVALRAQQKERLHEQYTVQETKRAPQVQIDQAVTLIVLGVLGAIMFVASAVLTADGTIGSATAAHYAVPWFGFLLFGSIEIAILVFLLVYYVLGSRVDYDGNPVRATQWFVAMVIGSVVAVALSAYHVLDVYHFDWTNISLWVGVGIRLVTTVFFVFCAKACARVLFAKAIRL